MPSTPSLFREDERIIDKKLNQMREFLGDSVSGEELRHLLKKNAGSVHFAIAAYYERTSQATESARVQNDAAYWIRNMLTTDYYLGSCTVEASITRRLETGIQPGVRYIMRTIDDLIIKSALDSMCFGKEIFCALFLCLVLLWGVLKILGKP
jgi:hypothetical protein